MSETEHACDEKRETLSCSVSAEFQADRQKQLGHVMMEGAVYSRNYTSVAFINLTRITGISYAG